MLPLPHLCSSPAMENRVVFMLNQYRSLSSRDIQVRTLTGQGELLLLLWAKGKKHPLSAWCLALFQDLYHNRSTSTVSSVQTRKLRGRAGYAPLVLELQAHPVGISLVTLGRGHCKPHLEPPHQLWSSGTHGRLCAEGRKLREGRRCSLPLSSSSQHHRSSRQRRPGGNDFRPPRYLQHSGFQKPGQAPYRCSSFCGAPCIRGLSDSTPGPSSRPQGPTALPLPRPRCDKCFLQVMAALGSTFALTASQHLSDALQ